MKKATLLYLISLLIIVLPLFTACEKVIELDLDTQEKELVIDAHIDWEKGTTGQEQTILLSYTQPYYSQEAPEGASGATVLVADNQGNICCILSLYMSRALYKPKGKIGQGDIP